MRLVLRLWSVVMLALACACSDGGDGSSGGADASGLDVIPHDSGLFPVPCGDLACSETEYCLVTPAGPCEPTDGGTCGANQEACQKEGVPGCTAPRTHGCQPIPSACLALPPCPCLVAYDVCPNMGRPSCLVSERQGPTVECPYP